MAHQDIPMSSSRQVYPPPTLLPATPSDIPTLAHIGAVATTPDLFHRILFPNLAAQEKIVAEGLLDTLRNPNLSSYFVKAVTETGEIMGWAGFLVMPKEYKYKPEENIGLFGFAQTAATANSDDEFEFPSKSGLSESLRQEVMKFMTGWMEGKRHVLVNGLMTLPKFQRRGVGTALMKWGSDMADKEGIPTFLQGTPFAHGLYEHIGYKTVGRIDIKLDEWVMGPSGEKIGWGEYTMWNMVRLPET